jgi:hypothetical protein
MVHKYVYLAWLRLAWTEFTLWVTNNCAEKTAVLKSSDCVDTMVGDLNHEKFHTVLQIWLN